MKMIDPRSFINLIPAKESEHRFELVLVNLSRFYVVFPPFISDCHIVCQLYLFLLSAYLCSALLFRQSLFKLTLLQMAQQRMSHSCMTMMECCGVKIGSGLELVIQSKME